MKEISTDVVIIGTGPICLIEALYYKRLGKKVLILEKENKAGGAWKTIDIGSIKNLDIGCHIYSRNEKAYQFLIKTLNINLVKVAPKPFNVLGNKYLLEIGWPFQILNLFYILFSSTLEILQFIFSSLPWNKKKEKTLASMGFAYYHIKTLKSNLIKSRKDFHFPKEGAIMLVKNLLQLIKEHQIPIFFNEKANTIVIEQGKKHSNIQTEHLNIITKKVIITSSSEIGLVKFGESIIEIPKQLYRFDHLALVVKDKNVRNISFGNFLNNPVLKRVNDYTRYVTYEGEKGCMVYMILFNPTYQIGTKAEVLNDVLHWLKYYKVISQEAIIKESHLLPYAVNYRSKETTIQLKNQFYPLIDPLFSGDLTASIEMNMERWTKVININQKQELIN